MSTLVSEGLLGEHVEGVEVRVEGDFERVDVVVVGLDVFPRRVVREEQQPLAADDEAVLAREDCQAADLQRLQSG